MRVFTDEWLQGIRRRYERLPAWQRPLIYSVATNSRYQSMRAEIEDWIAGLPQVTQECVIPRLRSRGNFVQTYHELAVGNVLKRLGYQVQYEKSIAGLTPDWYVQPRGEAGAFVVEVFTANVSRAARSKDRKTGDLLGRLQRIPIGVLLNVGLHRAELELHPRLNKTIAGTVERWLAKDTPPVGAELSLNGVIFRIMDRDPTYLNVRCIARDEALLVVTKRLRKNLQVKMRQYKSISSDAALPLVVGVVADPRTGLGLDDLADVLIGKEAVVVSFDRSSGQITGQPATRLADGLLLKAIPELSAVLWVSRFAGQWNMTALHNPSAVCPLPGNAFAEQ